jgi:hypothetical protein
MPCGHSQCFLSTGKRYLTRFSGGDRRGKEKVSGTFFGPVWRTQFYALRRKRRRVPFSDLFGARNSMPRGHSQCFLSTGKRYLTPFSLRRGSAGILTRSMANPQRCRCFPGRMPAYSLKLDHCQSWGWPTNPARTGFCTRHLQHANPNVCGASRKDAKLTLCETVPRPAPETDQRPQQCQPMPERPHRNISGGRPAPGTRL